MTYCSRKTLQLALCTALSARRPKLVRHLLSSQGYRACFAVIATWPVRQIADVLSILPHAEQLEICVRLPLSTQTQLLKMGMFGFEPFLLSGRSSFFFRLKNSLLRTWSIHCWLVMSWSDHKNISGLTQTQTIAVCVKPESDF